MMIAVLDFFIKLVGYSIFVFGIWLLARPYVLPSVRNAMKRRKSRFRKNTDVGFKKKKKHPIIFHLDMLIHTVFDNSSPSAAYSFFVLSGALFIITLLLLIRSLHSFMFPLFFALCIGAATYIILRVLLINMRIETSYEGDELVTEINNQYKINNLNMSE